MKFDIVIAERSDKMIYRDGDKCIKVFNEQYSKADILNEALNQARIEETGLNIPKLIEDCRMALIKLDKGVLDGNFIEGMACFGSFDKGIINF